MGANGIKSNLTLLILTSAMLQVACQPRFSLSLFGQQLELTAPVTEYGHEKVFADLIGVEALHFNVARGLSAKDLHEVVAVLLAGSGTITRPTNPVQVYIYTTHESPSTDVIEENRVHGFSVVEQDSETIRHRYFERTVESISEIDHLSIALTGPLSLDDVRLLHFAGTSGSSLPTRSTIFELTGSAYGSQSWSETWDRSVRITLLEDDQRNHGAFTLGLHGDELYLRLAGATGTYCGGNRDCPTGSDTCGNAPGGPDKVCGAIGGVRGNLFADLQRAAREHDLGNEFSIDFALLRSVRSEVIGRYPRSTGLIPDYYIVSLFADFDEPITRSLVQAIPDIQNAARILVTGSDTEVPLSTSLRDQLLEVIDYHQNVPEPAFQRALARLRDSVTRYHGLTRGELLALWSERAP